jgi:hypothetical protein
MTDKAEAAAERELFEQAYLAEFGDPRHIVNHGVELAWMTGPGAMWRAGRAALKAQPAPLTPEYGPIEVVGDMVRNLLALDQSAPIYAAFHVDYQGKRACRTRPVWISRERVVDGKWIDSARKDVPYNIIVWAKPQADEKAQPAPTEAQGEDSARLNAIEVSVRKMHKGYEYGCGYYGQPVYIEGRDELFRRYGLPVDLDLDAAPQPQEQS